MKQKIYKFLSSYDLSVYLLIVGGLYYAFLLAWGLTSPGGVVRNISKTAPFYLLYTLFFINLTLCLINRIGPIIRRVLLKEATGKKLLKVLPIAVEERIHQIFSRMGYSKAYVDQGTTIFVKGRLGPIGELLFHIAFYLLLLYFFISPFTRFEGKAVVVEGFPFWGEYEEYIEKPERDEFYKNAPEISFKVEEVGAEFYEDKLFFTDLYSKIFYPADTERHEATVRLKYGKWIGMVFINVQGMGYAPVYLLKDRNGKVLSSMTLNLNVFPPPTEDSFVLPDTPYRVYLKFYPDAVVKGNSILPRKLSIGESVYSIRIMRGKRIIFQGRIAPDEEIYFDNLRLSFPGVKKWVQIRIVKDPAIFLVWAGLMLLFIGLFWRVVFLRREVLIKKEHNSLSISVGSEWFSEIFARGIMKILKKIDTSVQL